MLVIAMILAGSFAFAQDKKTGDQYIADLDPVKEEKVIIDAARWASKKEEKKAAPALINLLSDSRVNVRLNAAMALGYIGEESAAKPLNNVILNDRSSDVRYAALLSSVRIGSKDSVDTWIKAKDSETDPVILDFLKKMDERAKKK